MKRLYTARASSLADYILGVMRHHAQAPWSIDDIKGELAWRYFVTGSLPSDDEVAAALAALEARGDVTSASVPGEESGP